MFTVTNEDAKQLLQKMNRDLDPDMTDRFCWLLNKYGRMQIEADELVARLFAAKTELILIDLLLTYRETPSLHFPLHCRVQVYLDDFVPLTDEQINKKFGDMWSW